MELGRCPGKVFGPAKFIRDVAEKTGQHFNASEKKPADTAPNLRAVQVEMQNCFGLHENTSATNASTAKTNHKKKITKEQYSYCVE